MRLYQNLPSPVLMIAGISLSVMVAIGAPNAMSAYHDDDTAKEEKGHKKYKTVKVIRTGKEPVIVEHSGSHVIIDRKDVEGEDGTKSFSYTVTSKNPHYAEALEKVENSLGEVEKRLKKARKKSEKKLLVTARDGLIAARDALQMRGHHMSKLYGGHTLAMMDGVHAEDMKSVRIKVREEMEGVREAIAEALGDMDVEIDTDGNVRRLRIDSFHDGQFELEGLKAEDLEALKHAEEKLRATRERLEKKLADKKKQKDN